MNKVELVQIINKPNVNTVVIVDPNGKMWDIGGMLIIDGVAEIHLMELIVG